MSCENHPGYNPFCFRVDEEGELSIGVPLETHWVDSVAMLGEKPKFKRRNLQMVKRIDTVERGGIPVEAIAKNMFGLFGRYVWECWDADLNDDVQIPECHFKQWYAQPTLQIFLRVGDREGVLPQTYSTMEDRDALLDCAEKLKINFRKSSKLVSITVMAELPRVRYA